MSAAELTVVIPWRKDGGHRDRSFAWCLQRYMALLPHAEILVEGDGKSSGPFNKALAVNRLVSRSSGQHVLLGDADSALDPDWVGPALEASRGGAWSLTRACHYLREDQTEALLARPATERIEPPDDCDYSGHVSWGGHVMMPRAAFDKVNGMDERFVGWGPEDHSFGLALDTLWGTHQRLDGDVIHLWHPVTHEATWGAEWRESVRLLHDRYVQVYRNPALMALVVKENRSASNG